MGAGIRDSIATAKNFFVMLLVFGSVQLIFMVQVYYTTAGLHNSAATQCDCQCTKQLHISAGRAASLSAEAASVVIRDHNQISQTDEQTLKKILNAEDKQLDKAFRKKVYSINGSNVEDPEEKTPYQDEQEDSPTDGKKDGVAGYTPFTYSPLKLNPKINETRSRCSGDHSNTIVVYVYSAPDHFTERESVRNTWGSVKTFHDKKFKVVFFIGALSDSTSSHYKQIREESDAHGDIVQDLSYIDAYRNLTLKGISALQWVSKYCPVPYRVIKVDDDTLVNPYQLVNFLLGQSEQTMTELICRVTRNVGPIRNKKSKYFVSVKEYSSDSYPAYCQGFGYIIPPNLIPQILEKVSQVKFIAMEDVFFTGLVREQTGAQVHSLTAMFFTTYNRFDTFLERITSRPGLLFIGHVHDTKAASVYWELITHRPKPHSHKKR